MHALQTNRQQSNTSSVLQSRLETPLKPTSGHWAKGFARVWLPLMLALMGWSTTASATEYSIQVGAFKSPSQAYADDLRSYGEVNTAQGGSGVTVFTVGRYNSLDAAKADLNRVADDYPGAFVRNMPAAARSADQAIPRKAATQQSSTPKTQTSDTMLWESLSESERRRVVYLDGVLHLKQGDQFVPLAEYRRSQGQ